MKLQIIPGCCAAKIIFDLGSCHGKPRARSQYEFDEWVSQKKLGWAINIILAITNDEQSVERKYLETIGFDSKNIDGLELHSISRRKFDNYIDQHREKPKQYLRKRERRFDW